MGFAPDVQGNPVYATGDGTIGVKGAFLRRVKQRTTKALFGCPKQNFGMIDFIGIFRSLFLQKIRLAVCLVGFDQYFIPADFLEFGKFEIEIHGLDQSHVEKSVATITASFLTTDFRGEIPRNLVENSIDLSYKRFIFCEKLR
jgi:hypothetical protein